MAEYSIVLNLSGNASSRIEKLATALSRADANARSLAGSLSAIGMAARSIPARTIRVAPGSTYGMPRSVGQRSATDGAFREYIQDMTRRSDALRSMSSYYRDLERQQQREARMADRTRRHLSFGSGFNLFGLSGRFSTVLSAGENGTILGMNAGALMKGLNVASVASSVVAAAVRGSIKAAVAGTVSRYAPGFLANAAFTKLLMSEGMAEGVRIVQRRNQARLGLGDATYEKANKAADDLAVSYGLDRSVALSSINVLSGLDIGGGRKITLGQATALSRVGGLISQSSGRPFEVVMTNLQQILSQVVPNIKDIRELVGQAPILGRYALDEMAKRGVAGTDYRQWLKEDKGNVLSILDRYDAENMSSIVMQARGVVTLGQQDFFAKLAENPNWMSVANNTVNILSVLGDAISNFLDSVSNNKDFQDSLYALVDLIETIGNNSDFLTQFVGKATTFIANKFDVTPDRYGGLERSQRVSTVKSVFEQNKEYIKQQYLASGVVRSDNPYVREKKAEMFYASLLGKATRLGDNSLLDAVRFLGIEGKGLDIRDSGPTMGGYAGAGMYSTVVASGLARPLYPATMEQFKRYSPTFGLSYSATQKAFDSSRNFYNTYSAINPADFYRYVNRSISEENTDSVGSNISRTTTTNADGEKLTGYNSDRRSLEIHFHAPIVEWNSTINTDDPQEVVDKVSNNIETAASRAIQIALLGASQKMSTRF